MKERPILFSADMINAILDGRKTQTRRVIKKNFPFIEKNGNNGIQDAFAELQNISVVQRCPYGQPGDQLWVRETFAKETNIDGSNPRIHYRADGEVPFEWKPSIHMPRAASRIDLLITGVRVERLNDITRHDAAREGVCTDLSLPIEQDPAWLNRRRFPEENFKALWEEINGSHTWWRNPFVWVVSFERIKP